MEIRENQNQNFDSFNKAPISNRSVYDCVHKLINFDNF